MACSNNFYAVHPEVGQDFVKEQVYISVQNQLTFQFCMFFCLEFVRRLKAAEKFNASSWIKNQQTTF